jgi:protein PhnA
MDMLMTRADSKCELCGGTSNLSSLPVDNEPTKDWDKSVLVCGVCRITIESGEEPSGGHWYCLQESAWSEIAAVQVLTYRLLHRATGQPWASDVLDQIYLEDDVLAWAQQGITSTDSSVAPTLDSNGTVLSDGDSVTLIKDLDVKGANFTAKRGTMVKNIRVGEDPTHIEGRVNKMSIMLKTCFLKKAN